MLFRTRMAEKVLLQKKCWIGVLQMPFAAYILMCRKIQDTHIKAVAGLISSITWAEGLKNTSTKVVSSWPEGFPSDHFLIISKFDLNY